MTKPRRFKHFWVTCCSRRAVSAQERHVQTSSYGGEIRRNDSRSLAYCTPKVPIGYPHLRLNPRINVWSIVGVSSVGVEVGMIGEYDRAYVQVDRSPSMRGHLVARQ